MSSEDYYCVAKASFRLLPNCNTVRYVEVPADLPGVVIFLHGVNDPGASYESVETGLCQGVNERLDRPDLMAGRYGATYRAAKDAPREELSSDQASILDDPDTYLYRRDTTAPKTRSLMIPFYWGYRAAPEHVKRDDAGDPFRMHNQFQDIRGNRLDRHFAKAGGFFANATNNLEDMYGEGFKANWKTATVEHAKPNNYLLFANAPLRHYFVLAAHRLAMLVSEIRRVSPDETITIMGHSQGTLIALLAQALLVDKGQRCADTLILVDSPYSVLPKVTPKDHDTLATLIRIVTAVTQTPHAQPPLSALRNSKTYGGRTGVRWSPTQGTRTDKIGNLTVFPERDNRGKVYLYFCPDDTTVALDDVQGIGTYGVPDATPDGRPAMMALQSMGFYQRLWTRRQRDGDPVQVGKPPQPEFIRAPGEHRYPGASLVTGVVSQAPIAEGQERLINAEALNPPHAPQMFGGEAVKGSPTTAGLDKPDEVAKSVALGKDAATFLWIKMPAEYDAPNTTQQEALIRFNGLSTDPEDHTRAVRKGAARSSFSSCHEREETPREARARMEHDQGAWGANSYHSAILRSPENQRWVTAMDIAIGQARCLDHPAMREVLVAIADWKMDEVQYSIVTKLPGWSRLSAEAQALVESSHLYYRDGKFPSSDLVPLTPPSLLAGTAKKGVGL
ncbi:T6SS effector phospholipase Tle3 domain-containing protein [Pseudomonas sp. LB3P31]